MNNPTSYTKTITIILIFFFSDDDDNTEEEVKKLNSELEELQKCLLNGAADLDLVMENKLTTKL